MKLPFQQIEMTAADVAKGHPLLVYDIDANACGQATVFCRSGREQNTVQILIS